MRQTNGDARCWGRDDSGQLGDEATSPGDLSVAPVLVKGTDAAFSILELYPATHTTCGRASDGKVYCWGDNRFGQMGVAAVPGGIDKPTALDWGGTPKAGPFVAVGDANICVHDSADELYCAGAVGNHILGTFGSHRLLQTTALAAPQ